MRDRAPADRIKRVPAKCIKGDLTVDRKREILLGIRHSIEVMLEAINDGADIKEVKSGLDGLLGSINRMLQEKGDGYEG